MLHSYISPVSTRAPPFTMNRSIRYRYKGMLEYPAYFRIDTYFCNTLRSLVAPLPCERISGGLTISTIRLKSHTDDPMCAEGGSKKPSVHRFTHGGAQFMSTKTHPRHGLQNVQCVIKMYKGRDYKMPSPSRVETTLDLTTFHIMCQRRWDH